MFAAIEVDVMTHGELPMCLCSKHRGVGFQLEDVARCRLGRCSWTRMRCGCREIAEGRGANANHARGPDLARGAPVRDGV